MKRAAYMNVRASGVAFGRGKIFGAFFLLTFLKKDNIVELDDDDFAPKPLPSLAVQTDLESFREYHVNARTAAVSLTCP